MEASVTVIVRSEDILKNDEKRRGKMAGDVIN